MTAVHEILEKTCFVLVYKTKGRYQQVRDRGVTARHLEEALTIAKLDRSVLIDAYKFEEGGFFPLLLAEAIEVGVKS
jgi:hypothetical protein